MRVWFLGQRSTNDSISMYICTLMPGFTTHKLKKQVSMITKYHINTRQTNPRHYKDESQNTISLKTSDRHPSLSLFWYSLLCVLSSFAIILMEKGELVALFLLSYRCLATINVQWLFLTVPWVGLQRDCGIS